ncbi:hypothetical protein DAPPUDRAFT_107984 [Daphnia pulex]|uniref:guanylate cyclase n=1 Tax=Daphnia pulex TaxID=6669 RepID=E9GYS5_DAPPU|nr:hypothetical protein DAPPUDRAFT_107984 [Daphnia pulex]|eukprot:EFX75362.1 hypothetical protein DAPPUDRAFT_107984 [Daphnia pulex]
MEDPTGQLSASTHARSASHVRTLSISDYSKIKIYGIIFVTVGSVIQDLVMKLANAAVTIIANGWTVQDFFAYFGRCFIRAAGTFGYEKLIKRCGRFFCDFLSAFDTVHLHIKYRYPKMDHPFIYVLEEDAEGALIHYRTSRCGFPPFLYGLLDQVAADFYGLQLLMGHVPDEPCAIEHGASMTLVRKANFLTSTTANIQQESLPQLSSSILLQLFPFCLIFRFNLKIIAAGNQLKQMFLWRMLIGQILPDVARLRRPRLNLTWDNLVTLQRVACELDEIMLSNNTEEYQLSKICKTVSDDRKNDQPLHLFLCGEMRYMKDWQAIIYLFNPLSDLSLHGHGRELVMTGQQRSIVPDLYERTEEKAKELQITHELLDEWKRRGNELLYSMIPESIAESLR